MEVKDKSAWFLGVTSESSSKKGHVSLTPPGGYWSLSLQHGRLFSNQESGFVPLGGKVQKLLRVGVFLDCDGGGPGFYDAVDMGKLHNLNASFHGQTVYPFFGQGKKDGTGQFQMCHYY